MRLRLIVATMLMLAPLLAQAQSVPERWKRAWPQTRLAEAGEITEAGVRLSYAEGQAPALVDRLRHSDPGISARSASHLFVMAQLFSTKGPADAGLFRLS